MAPLFAIAVDTSPRLMTFLFAMLPIAELRGAIPYAIWIGKLDWKEAYILAVAGNFVPVIPLLLFLERISTWLKKYPLGERFFTWFFERARRKGSLIERFEALGLALFVAVPLPVTGAWTGCAAAIVFGVRRRLAVPAIALGILLAGCVVTLASLGIISFWGIRSGG